MEDGRCERCGSGAIHYRSTAGRDPNDYVVVGGRRYFVGPEYSRPDSPRGMGGRVYVLRDLLTGEVRTTDNLWDLGDPPTDIFVDTHEFLGRAPELVRGPNGGGMISIWTNG
jgi:hypothetical protein